MQSLHDIKLTRSVFVPLPTRDLRPRVVAATPRDRFPRTTALFGRKKQGEEETSKTKVKGPIKSTPPKKKGFSLFGGGGGGQCSRCKGAEYMDCPTCEGKGKFSGKGKGPSFKGNILERNKCYDCQGFGLVSCSKCSRGRGLTPEQRGER
eukprot:CAMPEP_0114255838 /NCGR_PEP_ID=MMETSP0058-20121206/17803_1 /TAXON_ID=36894 /ORGANISM="Pyramimonas parkeae, CCMP726" /LENGTH=149 /DNA_ID=CAMNT_0001370305 /DNA_START=8 /DNA_END=457 /DNA_ORIENTATION=+